MRVRWPDSQPQQGFTLVELMIALVLMGLALSLMLGGLRYSAKVWTSAEQQLFTLADLQSTRRLLGNTLGHAQRTIYIDNAEKRYLFNGDAESVLFAAYMPPYPDVGGLYLNELYVKKRDSEYQLRLKRRLLTAEDKPFGFWTADDDVIVMKSQSPLNFSYFGPLDEQDEEGRWQSEWDTEAAMPQLVKLHFGDAATRDGKWPDLIVQIQSDIDFYCTIGRDGTCWLLQ